MSIDDYESAKELDYHAERIEELNREHTDLQRDVDSCREEYEYALAEGDTLAEEELKSLWREYDEALDKLHEFRNENREFLI